MKNLSEIVNVVDFISIKGESNKIIKSISYNSKFMEQDSIFVAIKGETVDGHSFINSAIEKGAIAIFCEYLPEEINENITYILCENNRKTLAQISHFFYDYPTRKLKIVGITGTNGKTTISFILKSIFDNAGYNCAVIGTTGIFFNNKQLPTNNTTPESLDLIKIFDLMISENVDFIFMEVSSHSLIMNRVYGIEFFGAIFTNLSLDHLDFHKNMQNYAEAKKILFDNLPEESISCLNGDDDYSKFMVKDTKSNNISFIGRKNSNDIIIVDEELDLISSKYILSGKFEINIDTKLIGSFNVENTAICAAFAMNFGLAQKNVAEGIKNADGAPGRMQKINLNNGAIGIVDYAHTPDALEKALLSIKNTIKDSKIISVFGCGGDRDKSKRPLMGKISSELADFTIITSDNPRTENPTDIIDDILTGISGNLLNKTTIIEDRAEAIKYSVSIAKPNDVILIAGKGHENYQIIGKTKTHFDDFEQLKLYCIK